MAAGTLPVMNQSCAPLDLTSTATPVVTRVETVILDLPTIRPHKLSVATMDGQVLMLVRVHCSDGIVGCCTLSAEDPEFWPDALKGEAAYLHKLAVRRTHAGRGVSSALIEACRHAARTQGCAKLRLDCHPNLRGLYERLGFTHVDTFNPGWDPTFIAERLELEI